MTYLIGIDGGGTKTSAVVGTEAGLEIARATAGPCNIAAMLPEEAFASVTAAITAACHAANVESESIAAICACVAGFSAIPRRLALLESLRLAYPQAAVAVEPDYAAGLTGGTGGEPGIVVIAGTGSVAYGENEGGESARAGAYGYLIDDAGSGYGVGREAIAAVLRAHDGTGEATSLSERLLAELGLTDPIGLIAEVYGGRLERTAIAALARMVSVEAEAGDAAARKILHRAGGALAILAEAVARKLFPDSPCTIVTVGSLWKAGSALTDVFVRSASRFAPGAEVIMPKRDPASGALLRARSLF